MTARVDPERRVRYLTLSLYAQAVVERLMEPPCNRPKDLSDMIGEVEDALVALKSSERRHFTSKSGKSGLRPFRHYEQRSTLNKVLSRRVQADADTKKLHEALKTVREDPGTAVQQVVDGRPALDRGRIVPLVRGCVLNHDLGEARVPEVLRQYECRVVPNDVVKPNVDPVVRR